MSKVFLNYSRADEAFVEKLHRRLTGDGVECFLDKASIHWGDNWVLALEKAVQTCDYLVPILTPDYLKSEWAQWERAAVLAIARDRIRPLLLKRCPQLPAFLRATQVIDITTTAEYERVYPEICRKLGGKPLTESLPVDRSKLPPRAALPSRRRMPYLSLGDVFVGRLSDLWNVFDLLHQGKTAVVQGTGLIAGAGGIGKTQLAIEYVHRFAGYYPNGVFWLDADRGLETAIEQLADAAQIEIDPTMETHRRLEQLWILLEQGGAALVVLDNFPETDPLEPWLPKSGPIHVLVTTRRRDLTRFHPLNLNFLDEAAGLELLSSGSRKHGPEATELVQTLGGLPLALEIARNYLDLRPDLSPAQLAEIIGQSGEMAVLDDFARHYAGELPSGHEKQVAATFRLSWDLASEDAKEVLFAIALLAPKAVPSRLLRSILSWPGDNPLRDRLGEALSELAVRLSLAELDQDNDPWVHRLVRGFARFVELEGASAAKDDGMARRRDAAVKALRAEMGRVKDLADTGSFSELEKCLPHAEELFGVDSCPAEERTDLANYLRWHHLKWGRYRLAKHWGMNALRTAQEGFPPGHPSIATSQSNLALVLQDLGEMEEARSLLREALAAHRASLPPGHPSIATDQSNLALVLQDLGELEEARSLLREALAADRASFPPGHPSIATRQSNLALVLQDLGELEEARSLLREALAAARASFPPGHPSIATSQSNLALVLKDLGELEEARSLLREALASARASFPPGHPSIATRQSNLALVLQGLGELEEARSLLREALASDRASFPPGHPSIATRQSNLALVLKDLGELEEARSLLREALDSCVETLGPEHPKTKIVRRNLEKLEKSS